MSIYVAFQQFPFNWTIGLFSQSRLASLNSKNDDGGGGKKKAAPTESCPQLLLPENDLLHVHKTFLCNNRYIQERAREMQRNAEKLLSSGSAFHSYKVTVVHSTGIPAQSIYRECGSIIQVPAVPANALSAFTVHFS